MGTDFLCAIAHKPPPACIPLGDADAVVIATTDGIRAHIGHFGDSKYYFIYEVRKDPRFPELEVVVNPFREGEEEHKHGNMAKRRGLLELFKNPDALVATFFGPGGKEFFRSHGISRL